MTDGERIVALERRVADLEGQVDLLLELAGARVPQRAAPAPAPADHHDPRLVEELRQGNLIRAIQRYRELHGVGLAEARAACEDLVDELGLRR